jgi:hypothetical protein
MIASERVRREANLQRLDERIGEQLCDLLDRYKVLRTVIELRGPLRQI